MKSYSESIKEALDADPDHSIIVGDKFHIKRNDAGEAILKIFHPVEKEISLGCASLDHLRMIAESIEAGEAEDKDKNKKKKTGDPVDDNPFFPDHDEEPESGSVDENPFID